MDVLQFKPLIKRARWGGRRLGTLLNKPLGDETDYAESWEIADHGLDQSIVISGEYSGWSLSNLMAAHGERVLGYPQAVQFPLLIKFLDANDRLSLQVHPNDELARLGNPAENGKTEAWVILAAEPGSLLYSGLKQGVDRAAFENAIQTESLADVLHTIDASVGDCVFIPAGTVHAIGEGIVLAEIQQQSDLTYRIHDWGRFGADGKPREIHVEQSLLCTDFDQGPVDPVAPKTISCSAGHRHETLVESDYFVIERRISSHSIDVATHGLFRIVMVLDGDAQLTGHGDAIQLQAGSTVLIPADLDCAVIQPAAECTWLESSVPIRFRP
jgi:mannose-6-phosphate isomerase